MKIMDKILQKKSKMHVGFLCTLLAEQGSCFQGCCALRALRAKHDKGLKAKPVVGNKDALLPHAKPSAICV